MADSHAKHHDYHLVNPSYKPLLGAIAAFALALGLIEFFISKKAGAPHLYFLVPGIILVAATMWLWWADVIHEAQTGDHTPVVQLHLRYGMLLFIASEVMFFVAWFWGYFDAALFPGEINHLMVHATNPDGSMVLDGHGHAVLEDSGRILGLVQRNDLTGGTWPPKPSDTFQHTFNPWGLPLVNTLILLTSGTTVTAAHHALLENNRKGLIWGLTATVVLGILFTLCQAWEYAHAGFTFSGSQYGSVFFMATGFHGAHVIIGTIFLFVCLMRAIAGQFTPKQHFGFEAAAWYWHFVDVVWLFLFSCIYVWGAGPTTG
jgi:cytochrome c oxidase subunit III